MSYFRTLAEHFSQCRMSDIDDETLHQVRRSLVNYLGGSVYTASHDSCAQLLAMIRTMDTGGKSTVWSEALPAAPMIAAFSNAARLSSLELNDGTKASAHPGIYVWSSTLATYQQYGGSVEDVIRAVVFGYDVCTRMAMLSIERILELGLHNPGFVGGLGAVAAAGLLRGLSVDELCNAFGIAASLLPLCPFVSFVEGSDSKDLYGGWGAYLGLFAVEAASRGLTGPEHVLKGIKALDTIFQGDSGKEIEPGNPYLINWLSIKEYPACFAVSPAVNAVLALQRKHAIDPEQIESVVVDTYPYSFDLNQGVGRSPNVTSGKLSLYYTVAVVLMDGQLSPDAFADETLHDTRYQALRDKITTKRHDAYGNGPTGIRGCVIEIRMKDGQVLVEEFNATENKKIYSDEMLYEKYCGLTKDVLTPPQQKELYDFAMQMDVKQDLDSILHLLHTLPKVHKN
ncbi:MAG: MmgE/PrpD family protein [Clostridia bacterium]